RLRPDRLQDADAERAVPHRHGRPPVGDAVEGDADGEPGPRAERLGGVGRQAHHGAAAPPRRLDLADELDPRHAADGSGRRRPTPTGFSSRSPAWKYRRSRAELSRTLGAVATRPSGIVGALVG